MQQFALSRFVWLLALAGSLACTSHPTTSTATAVAVAPTPADRPVPLPTPQTIPPVTATPLSGTPSPIAVLRPFSLPQATAEQRAAAATSTRLYLTGFDFYTVSVVDPLSGYAIHEIPVKAQNPGLAISPDGARLYVLDMWWNRQDERAEGELSVYETATWKVIDHKPIDRPALLLGGTPMGLSGDGRWLLIASFDYSSRQGTTTVIDTRTMEPSSAGVLREPAGCSEPWSPPRLVGRPGHPRLYAPCKGTVVALDVHTLSRVWQADAPSTHQLDLTVSPDGMRLYGIYPRVITNCCRGTSVYVEETELVLKVWDTQTGDAIRTLKLSEVLDVPTATIGRGDGAYLAVSPDGTRLYVLWENKMWGIATGALLAPDSRNLEIREVALPAPADGMVISGTGDELYMLASTSGDLPRRGRGMWAVNTGRFEIVRQTTDWPSFTAWPLIYAAPPPQSRNAKEPVHDCPVSRPPVKNDALDVTVPFDGVTAGVREEDKVQISSIYQGCGAGGIGEKFGADRLIRGKLTAEVRRLDGLSPPAKVSIPDGYGDIGFQVFGVTFPVPGCWEITLHIKDKQLRFVVKVVGDAAACYLSPVAQGKPEDANTASFTDTWYSNPDRTLWAGVDRGARWVSGRGIKVLWAKPERTALTATATTLGGDGRVVDFTIPGGYFELPYQASGIEFPSPGCWRIDASAGSERVTFVVLVGRD